MKVFILLLSSLLFKFIQPFEENEFYYSNFCDEQIIESLFPTKRIKSHRYDVNTIKIVDGESIDSSIVHVLGPKLLHDNWCQYEYFSCGRVALSRFLDTYLIGAKVKSSDSDDRLLFLINVCNKYLKSCATVSCELSSCPEVYQSLYTIMNNGTLILYERAEIIDDVFCGNIAEIPWGVKIKMKIFGLFSKSNRYKSILKLRVDRHGFLYVE